MTEFQIQKSTLVQFASAAQTRTFAEELDLLSAQATDLEWLIKGLQTHKYNGISNDSQLLEQRRIKYGSNKKHQRQPSSFWDLFKQALDDFILKVLIFASILSIVIEVGTAEGQDRKTAWIEGFAILLAVAICGLVTAANNYQKERQFQELNGVADERKRVTIRRDGLLMELHQDEILVGDIVNINEGMEIPADSILLEANQITTDQSAMTGQTDPLYKNTFAQCLKKKTEIQQSGHKNTTDKHEIPSPILLSGTKVLTGEGKMVVLVVGQESCIGKIRALLTQEEDTLTPLQQKLQVIANDIGKLGLYSSIAIFVVLVIRFTIQKIFQQNWDSSKDIKQLISYFILAITVVVVAIPEGLPLSVTLSLAVSVKQMLKDNNLVRKMEACETMGSANNICSDKTGTLTMNKMTLTQIWNESFINIESHKEKIDLDEISQCKNWSELVKMCISVNSTANLYPEEKGSSTEIALLKFLEKTGVDYAGYRQKYQPSLKYPFSSLRKRMSVILAHNQDSFIFVKGASEIVLDCCTSWHNINTGQIQEFTSDSKKSMKAAINKMAQSSLRTLCLAYKKINQEIDLEQKDEKGIFSVEKNDLILLGIFGVRDIPRKEVPDAIKKCHKAGITVRMVTGDNILTAKAIANDVGIIKEGDDSLIMEGTDFINLVGGVVCKKCRTKVCQCARDLKQAEQLGKDLRIDTIQNAQEFDKIKDKLLVLARSRPEDKYALVTGLRQRGDVVAVTGDGTNDAPALKKADVGFAMGISGTEVARQAAAIILLDDNFNSIVKAVMWGRNIYDSIRKFIQFQITVNLVAVFITLIGGALMKQQVLAPIQMLWINLIMDTLASLALATEAPTQQLLDRTPSSRNESIISKAMMKHIVGQAVFQMMVMLILIFAGERFIPQYVDSLDSKVFAHHPEWKWSNGIVGGTVRSGRLNTVLGSNDYEPIFNATGVYSRHFTFIFNVFVMMQVFNFFNCRKIHQQRNILSGITKNKIFIIIVASIMVLQVILVTFVGSALHVYPNYGLTIQQWFLCILIGFMSIPVGLALKHFNIDKQQQPFKIEVNKSEQQDLIQQPLTGTRVIRVKRISDMPQIQLYPKKQDHGYASILN